MTITLLIIGVILSAVLSFVFVANQAKKFAIAPPTPLIDLDTMYDIIYERLDEKTGSAITPADLSKILDGVIVYLSRAELIQETIIDSENKEIKTFDIEDIAKSICTNTKDLDVDNIALTTVIEMVITYLMDIHAVS